MRLRGMRRLLSRNRLLGGVGRGGVRWSGMGERGGGGGGEIILNQVMWCRHVLKVSREWNYVIVATYVKFYCASVAVFTAVVVVGRSQSREESC